MAYLLPTVLGAAATAWAGLQFKQERADGEFVKNLPVFRKMLIYIMPTRNESVVYFDRAIDATKLLAYLEEARAKFDANMTHTLVAAINIGLAENPRMNQFVVGRRLYKRKGRFITFSMKRKKLDQSAYLAAPKMEMIDGETFSKLVQRINGDISLQRSGKRTHEDKEYDFFSLLPRPVMNGLVKLVRTLDYHNILPHDLFIKTDGMYTSTFIANLGSLGMAPGYHHLYEHGTCPLFLMVGRIEERPWVVDGKIEVRPVLPLRFTFDERIADGLDAHHGIESVARVLEDPAHWLGCIASDGSDERSMWPHGETVKSPVDALRGIED